MKRLAVYDLNKYLLEATDVGPLLGYPDHVDLRPIVPVQQQPEMNDNNSSYPYIMYTWRTRPGIDDWWMTEEDVTYTIWGKEYDELAEVANEVINVTRAMDESASDMNSWLMANTTNMDFFYHWTRVVGSFSPDAAQQEAGRLGWMITLRMGYVPLNGRHIS